ncbi:hypothetical protein CSUI_009680 [Cystoisospora suis]|uniref:Transmembrane protein n=1 Tax=Cystoisospora suis TaxID=483139 RepID=A0A2C6KJB2_9APIC|nr:hypothetical protein CSUI_009680 [Cystoisospora suis]
MKKRFSLFFLHLLYLLFLFLEKSIFDEQRELRSLFLDFLLLVYAYLECMYSTSLSFPGVHTPP